MHGTVKIQCKNWPDKLSCSHCTGLGLFRRLLNRFDVDKIYENQIEMNTMWKALMVSLVPSLDIWM